MTSTTPDLRAAPLGEPKPIIPPLASFYSHARELSWLVVRLTAGGMLLLHGIVKTMAVADKGMAAWAAGFAAGGLARRGIEPALPLAYAVLAIETIGALLIVLGLFTRLAAAAAAIEFAVITFVAHWGERFRFQLRRGWLGISAVLGSHPFCYRLARRRALFAGPEAGLGTVIT